MIGGSHFWPDRSPSSRSPMTTSLLVVWDAATGGNSGSSLVPPEFAKTETTGDLRLSADGRTLTTTASSR